MGSNHCFILRQLDTSVSSLQVLGFIQESLQRTIIKLKSLNTINNSMNKADSATHVASCLLDKGDPFHSLSAGVLFCQGFFVKIIFWEDKGQCSQVTRQLCYIFLLCPKHIMHLVLLW